MGTAPQRPPPPNYALSYNASADSFDEEGSQVQITGVRLLGLAAAELVARHIKDELLRDRTLCDLRTAREKLIRDFLIYTPRSIWLGTQSEVADLIAALGLAAAGYADPDMRQLVFETAADILSRSSVDDRNPGDRV